MSTNYNSDNERQAFFLLKDIMETVLLLEHTPTEFAKGKLEQQRDELQLLLQTASDIGIEYLQEVWQGCFFLAKEQVEKEHALFIEEADLSWQQIFDTEF